MSTIHVVLLGFCAWTLLLVVVGIGVPRLYHAFVRGRSPTEFTPQGSELGPVVARVARAHANCVENLPLLAGLVLVAQAAGATALLDPLAWPFLAARIAQSLVHIASGSAAAIGLRFAFFFVQVVIYVVWIVRLAALACPALGA
ncbi:MAG: hypothetical protein KatS3mg121_0665 [Gammaproteobacteria bacterium]|nr:MAG: hypothetical protein KatS3mg121_0665 [Gammaproteobacteria bacterium]